MSLKNKLSDYWIINKFDISEKDNLLCENDGTIYYMKMAALRRSISDFVQIVTNKRIPVEFLHGDQSFTDGKTVFLSSQIDGDIDPTVGLALHEGSHILLTDFTLLLSLDHGIKSWLRTLGESKGLSIEGVTFFVKNILNYIEDRRIDYYIYSNAPGYRGYYVALYDKYFNSTLVSKALKSSEYRSETMDSYLFRLINLTNPNTDLTALKGLKEINDIISLPTIDRLKNTMDSLLLTHSVCEIILRYIKKLTPEQSQKFDSDNKSKDGNSGKKIVVMNSDQELDSVDSSTKLSPAELDQLLQDIKDQKAFIAGNIKKDKMSSDASDIIGKLQDSKTEIKDVTVDSDLVKKYYSSICDLPPYKVIVINKVTESMFTSKFLSFVNPYTDTAMDNAVSDGIRIGRQLGRKLQIRNEQKLTTYIRQPQGHIDKRLLSELGCGNTSIFKHTYVETYTDAILHISIDISGSMKSDNKLSNAIRCVTAICQAASMTNGNLNIVVDVRHTDRNGDPLIAILYDSRVDKMSKVKKLFPKITANGATPEGICFSAIENIITSSSTKLNSYFLNLSDGEPYFTNYSGELAAEHTRLEVNKMRLKGVKILSYFIGTSDSSYFKLMYGKSAEFIDTANLLDIARTLNKMFITEK